MYGLLLTVSFLISWNISTCELSCQGIFISLPSYLAKKKFRPIEEIRAELEDQMGWKIKSDFESMKDHLLAVLQDNVTDSLKMDTLDSLEDYVHQIDNARDLDKIDGYKVLNELLNSSSDEIKEKAANVIAAAVQR